jgi:hypothetical protein
MSKYNKFNTLLETAFGYYNNGGFREGSCVKLKPAFFNCQYFKDFLNDNFGNYLKELVSKNKDYFFFIHRVASDGATQNTKDSNSNYGSSPLYLELKFDPRVVSVPTEMQKFTVPASLEYLEVVKFDGNNLPPVQSEPNKYEKAFYSKPQVVKNDFDIKNRPTDDSLPTKNINIS